MAYEWNEQFNLQTYLSEMREESRTQYSELDAKLDTIKDTLGEHNTRITIVENTRKLLVWASGALVVGVIGFIFDMVKNHLSQHP